MPSYVLADPLVARFTQCFVFQERSWLVWSWCTKKSHFLAKVQFFFYIVVSNTYYVVFMVCFSSSFIP